jgi:hypothetical protein
MINSYNCRSSGRGKGVKLNRIRILKRSVSVTQTRDHFIHQIPTLRDELICVVSDRLTSIFMRNRNHTPTREWNPCPHPDVSEMEYALRTLIRFSWIVMNNGS